MYLQQKQSNAHKKKAGFVVYQYTTEPSHSVVAEWLLSPQRDL